MDAQSITVTGIGKLLHLKSSIKLWPCPFSNLKSTVLVYWLAINELMLLSSHAFQVKISFIPIRVVHMYYLQFSVKSKGRLYGIIRAHAHYQNHYNVHRKVSIQCLKY